MVGNLNVNYFLSSDISQNLAVILGSLCKNMTDLSWSHTEKSANITALSALEIFLYDMP